MKSKSKLSLSVFFFIFFLYLAAVTSDLESDRQALVVLRNSVRGRPLLWNMSASPCTWHGVHCDAGRVTELRLPGSGLFGSLPVGGIGNLTELQTLSLRFNSLSGPIPSDFSNLVLLRYLYLQGNSFSGEIPSFLFTLPNIIRINLGENNLSGPIPDNVNSATRLATLYLERNQLTGPIPEITITLQQFNVSSNQLNGSIPDSLSGFPQAAFQGNSLCGKPLNPCDATAESPNSPPGPSPGKKDSDKLSAGAIAGIVIACVVVLLVLLFILFCLCRKRKKEENVPSRNIEAPVVAPTSAAAIPRETAGNVPPAKAESGAVNKDLTFFVKSFGEFDLDGLLKASAEVLGKGTVGSSYKASFDHGLVVAVKRLRDVVVPEKDFRERLQVLGSMSHANLVTLIAYYFSRDEKLLVFEYMSRGSLSALLHGNKGSGRTQLNWETRAGIALGAARAISYLHSRDSTTSHGNIKSSNILLSDSYEAKVSDYGLAPIISSTSAPNRIDGYRAPEVTDARKISQKADVYSFGVLILELLTALQGNLQHISN
ncbi:hypothetical protein EUTSA_v10020304mg [Eutrema salsugineum]|uniref:Protein kinase domain-containing protein n=1 Tax=Eutrema salsugineum TaxID=72664 RepID=V4M4E4_EUTSA|nr:probable inactive receptor kinase At3g02880 isoform X2 [Eutrema salsugineum]ESQ49822.1 hypothetical protein EUTSA_v10020304mg [Eutrema salsugineum]